MAYWAQGGGLSLSQLSPQSFLFYTGYNVVNITHVFIAIGINISVAPMNFSDALFPQTSMWQLLVDRLTNGKVLRLVGLHVLAD